MDSRIQNLARRTPDLARNQSQTHFRVNWRLVLCENNQRRLALIQARIHSRCYFHAPGKRETDMHTVAHLVCRERAFDLFDDFFARWNFGE